MPCKKKGQEDGEAQSFPQMRPRWKLIHVERCVLASPTRREQPGCTQGPELQEGGLSLLFVHGFSYPGTSGRTLCVSSLLSFRSQRTFDPDACAEHTCSLSSDVRCHLTPHLPCTSGYAMVLHMGLASDTRAISSS